MEQEVPKVEKKAESTSPAKEAVEILLKEVEIDIKKQELSYSKLADELQVERMKIENEQVKKSGSGWNSPLDQLLAVSKAWTIDNSKTMPGGEAVLMSLWDEDEMAEIKHLIMLKTRKL
jgi:hypothetical protein